MARAILALGFGCWFSLAPSALSVSTADVDVSKLPPPATNKIDFARDIKPILDASCLRCHGPEKPKSEFRLDTREAALKGGDHGIDLVPGNSAKSPLLHFVSYLVEDMEMPPLGKGKKLSAEQIGLLRAWIDQGVVWATNQNSRLISSSATTLFGGTVLSGDSHKFREHYLQREGVNGGLEEFEIFEQKSPDTKILMSGHILPDDYKLVLSADKNDLGFIHSGWTQYRKYYDDTGGFYPAFSPVAPSLDRDLYVDIGKAWVDFGLTLPHWPRLVLGYEYDYTHGTESSTEFGAFSPPGGNPLNPRNIAPASSAIHENTQIIKFDLDAEVKGVSIEERFRGEFYELNTQRTNISAVVSASPNSLPTGLSADNEMESTRYFQAANTIRLEKRFNDWLNGSAGYLYSKLNADSTLDLTTTIVTGIATGDRQWLLPQITLERESHVVNLNTLLGPFEGLTLSGGVQTEWTRQQGLGSGNLNQSAPTLLDNPAILGSDYDQSTVQESMSLRYTKIPFTVLFAEARLEQQRIGQSDQLSATFNVDKSEFMQTTDYSSQLVDFRFGFTTSPWQSVSLSAHYRRYETESGYQNDPLIQPGRQQTAYPAFIQSRDLLTDEIEGKLVLRPSAWFKTTLSYQFLTTGYWVETGPATNRFPGDASPGGNNFSGRDNSQIYSVSTTFIPTPALSLSTTFSYQPTSSTTAANGSPSVVPYDGDIYSVIASGSYALGKTMDLFASYSFSEANYGQNNFTSGVPLGIKYEQHAAQVALVRRFGKNITTRLQYGYYYYDEPSSGGANNYSAHAIFAALTLKLP